MCFSYRLFHSVSFLLWQYLFALSKEFVFWRGWQIQRQRIEQMLRFLQAERSDAQTSGSTNKKARENVKKSPR